MRHKLIVVVAGLATDAVDATMTLILRRWLLFLSLHYRLRYNEDGYFARPRTVHDRVWHDRTSMPPLLVAVMDTPEFQRLRGLKQLGK